MTGSLLLFANLLLAALVVGTMFGISLGYDPAELGCRRAVHEGASPVIQTHTSQENIPTMTEHNQ